MSVSMAMWHAQPKMVDSCKYLLSGFVVEDYFSLIAVAAAAPGLVFLVPCPELGPFEVAVPFGFEVYFGFAARLLLNVEALLVLVLVAAVLPVVVAAVCPGLVRVAATLDFALRHWT